MKIIDPTFEYISAPTRVEAYEIIATAMRNCYRAELNAMPATDEKMVEKAMKERHLSLLEFVDVSVNITCDRGVTHELVRHRLCSFAQESTRYCNYSGEKFGRELTFVYPWWTCNAGALDTKKYAIWEDAMRTAEARYMQMLDEGGSAQEARSVLPNSLAAKIAVKANLREWIHIFRMRCDTPAHPDMRVTMMPILISMLDLYPVVFQPVYNWLSQKGALK
jgi:thymidylate synthase (FAD)